MEDDDDHYRYGDGRMSSAIKAAIALLPELERETTFLANTKTLLTRTEIQTLIAALKELKDAQQ